MRGGRETHTGDQGLSVICYSKYIYKLDGKTMRYIEELCETLLQKLVISCEVIGPSLKSRV